MSAVQRPLPRGEGSNGEFYEFCRQGELRFQRCNDCGTWRHMPRESCNACGSLDWRWDRSSGKGQVFSWTVVHRALHPGFADALPYAVVIVELDEGVRMVSHVVDVPPQALKIGLPVEVFFDRIDETVTLPKFRARPDTPV